jgi:hypothetical protein
MIVVLFPLFVLAAMAVTFVVVYLSVALLGAWLREVCGRNGRGEP